MSGYDDGMAKAKALGPTRTGAFVVGPRFGGISLGRVEAENKVLRRVNRDRDKS